MALASTSVHVVDGAPQSGCFQCLCPQGKSSCLLPLWEALQDQQLPLILAAFKLLLQPWVLEHVRFCMPPLRVESKGSIFTSRKSLIHAENSSCSIESQDAENGEKALGHKGEVV